MDTDVLVRSSGGFTSYARQEFDLSGLDFNDSFNAALRSSALAILSLVDSFSESYSDVGILLDYVSRARSYCPFSPLTFEDSMWNECGSGVFQHIRYSSCFRDRSFYSFRPYVTDAFTCRFTLIRRLGNLSLELHPVKSSGWSVGSVWISENGVLTGRGFSGRRCLLKEFSVLYGWAVPSCALSLDVTEVCITLDSSVLVVDAASPGFLSLSSSYDLCWYHDARLTGIPVASLSVESSCLPLDE